MGVGVGRLMYAPTLTSHNPNPPFPLEGTGLNAYELSVTPGSYAWSGVAAGAVAGRVLSAAVGSYAWSGVAASVVSARLLSASVGSYTWDGVSPDLSTTIPPSWNPVSHPGPPYTTVLTDSITTTVLSPSITTEE